MKRIAKPPAELSALVRRHGRVLVKMLLAIVNRTEEDRPVRLSAAKILLDRGWGKVGDGPASEDGGRPPLAVIKRIIVFPGQHEQDDEDQDEAPVPDETGHQC